MFDSGKSCWETDPARQPWHLAEANFHLFSANQEVGAQIHWASEPWDSGSGGEKSQEEGAAFNLGLQMPTGGEGWRRPNPLGRYLF